MRYRKLGNTGLRVSEICLGTMTFGSRTEMDEAHRILDTAFDGGVTFLDTSDAYPAGKADVGGTEEIIGKWLAGRSRDQVIVATKGFGPTGPLPHQRGNSRQHLLSAVDDSLRRLGTDYIDLYQLHGPDRSTPIEETMQALDDLVRWGKVRYVGASNFRAWQLGLALGASDKAGIVRFVCDQPRYNILWRDIESDLLPLCRDQGLGVICFNPLAGGFLTGRYRNTEELQGDNWFTNRMTSQLYQGRYWDDIQREQVARLQDYFAERDQSITHAAISWVLAQRGVTSAIVGASRVEQIEDSLRYAEVQLTPEDLEFCDQPWYQIPRPTDPAVAIR